MWGPASRAHARLWTTGRPSPFPASRGEASHPAYSLRHTCSRKLNKRLHTQAHSGRKMETHVSQQMNGLTVVHPLDGILCCVLRRVRLFVTPWTVAHQPPPSMGILPAKNTATASHFLLQGIFLTQGSNARILHWWVDSLPLSHLIQP